MTVHHRQTPAPGARNMTQRIPALAVLLAPALGVTQPALAGIRFDGFGQVVAGRAPADDRPVVGVNEYESDVDFDAESLIALQATGSIDTGIDAVVQIVARGREDYDPEVSWAYVRYMIDQDWTLKVGRQRIPYYRFSDYLEVGAAYPFMRPPLGGYYIPFSNQNGVSLTGTHDFGDWILETQLIFGAVDEDVSYQGETLRIELDNNAGIALQADYDGWLSLRASYFSGAITIETPNLQPLVDGLRASGNADTASALAFDHDRTSFYSVSAEVSRGAWLLGAEHTHGDTGESFVGTVTSLAAYAGYRIGRWTPVVTWSRYDSRPSDKALRTLPADDPLYGTVTAALAANEGTHEYLSFGTRYDLTASLALKADYTRFTTDVPGESDSSVVSAGIVFTY